MKRILAALEDLGLTSFESEVYIYLLEDSPCTGYRAAQALRKAPANVYRVLDALVEKGAVEVDEGEARVYRPVPVSEFLDRLQQRFNRSRTLAQDELSRLPGPRPDVRAYQIHDREQVLGRCRRMLREAERSVLVEAFPELWDAIAEDLQQAARRGVAVLALVYEPVKLPGVTAVLHAQHERVLDRWPAQLLTLVTDGAQMLLALLASDGGDVIQCLWSRSPFLAWLVHSGLQGQIGFSGLRRRLEQQPVRDEIWVFIAQLTGPEILESPGYALLREQIGRNRPAAPGDEVRG